MVGQRAVHGRAETQQRLRVSLEDTPDFKDDFKIDRYFQFFFAQNRVSGAILGADSESFAGSEERNTFIARVVPTWKLGEKQTFALGISATVGGIDNQPTLREYGTNQVFASPGDQTIAAWAVDGTWTAGPWKLFAEFSQLYGTLTPSHYISGGPSNRYTDGLAGITYTRGPMTYRCVYSYGVYDNPYGRQGMLVPGITAKITSNCHALVRVYLLGRAQRFALAKRARWKTVIRWFWIGISDGIVTGREEVVSASVDAAGSRPATKRRPDSRQGSCLGQCGCHRPAR